MDEEDIIEKQSEVECQNSPSLNGRKLPKSFRRELRSAALTSFVLVGGCRGRGHLEAEKRIYVATIKAISQGPQNASNFPFILGYTSTAIIKCC